MKVSIIAAMARNRVIGRDNAMPWRLPAELKYFKRITMGKPIIMGRKTFESIGRPLPGRHNIVVTRRRGYAQAGITVVHGLHEALTAAGKVDEAVIIGGAELYRQSLPMADRLYLTEIEAELEGDTRFPEIRQGDWHEVSRERRSKDQNNPLDLTWIVLDRTAGEEPGVTARPPA
jgi:dihydrofolate reductase